MEREGEREMKRERERERARDSAWTFDTRPRSDLCEHAARGSPRLALGVSPKASLARRLAMAGHPGDHIGLVVTARVMGILVHPPPDDDTGQPAVIAVPSEVAALCVGPDAREPTPYRVRCFDDQGELEPAELGRYAEVSFITLPMADTTTAGIGHWPPDVPNLTSAAMNEVVDAWLRTEEEPSEVVTVRQLKAQLRACQDEIELLRVQLAQRAPPAPEYEPVE